MFIEIPLDRLVDQKLSESFIPLDPAPLTYHTDLHTGIFCLWLHPALHYNHLSWNVELCGLLRESFDLIPATPSLFPGLAILPTFRVKITRGEERIQSPSPVSSPRCQPPLLLS